MAGFQVAAEVLCVLTWAGSYLGRGVWTKYNGIKVYPALYSSQVGTELSARVILTLVREAFAELPSQPLTIDTGVSSAASVIFPIRDSLVRWEKMYTEPNETPEYSRALVDGGESERRLLITQGSLVAVHGRRTQAATGLETLLCQAFSGSDIAYFMAHRDGGFLRSSNPHISFWTSGHGMESAAAQTGLRDMFLFTRWDSERTFIESPSWGKGEPAYVQTKCMEALLDETCDGPLAEGEIPITPEACEVIEKVVRAVPPNARSLEALKLLKMSLVEAILDFQRAIERRHALAAMTVLNESQQILRDCQSASAVDQIEATARRIEADLRANPSGLSSTEISARFMRNAPAHMLRAAKDRLLREHRAVVSFMPTAGRRREVWRIGGAA